MASLRRLQKWISGSYWHLYLFVLALFLVPGSLFLYSIHSFNRDQEMERAKGENVEIAELVAGVVNSDFSKSISILQSISLQQGLRSAFERRDLRKVRDFLSENKAVDPDFLFLSVYDLDGTMVGIAPDDPGTLGRNFSYRDWYQGVVREWKPYVSEVYVTAVLPKQLVVAISVPLKNEAGAPIGIVMAAHRLSTINRRIQTATAGYASSIRVIDKNGNLVTSPEFDTGKDETHIVASPGPVHAALSGQPGTEIFGDGKQAMLVAYRPLRQFGGAVMVQRPLSEIAARQWLSEKHIWELSLIFLFVVLGCSHLLIQVYRHLQNSESRLRVIIETAHDAFVAIDSNGVIIDWSPKAETLFGWPGEAALGRSLAETIIPAPMRQAHNEGIRRYLASRRSRILGRRIEMTAITRSGREIPVELSVASREFNGQTRFNAFIRDITERKQAHEKIEQKNRELELRNREVERANSMKSQFLASMSHELRTPLSAILGFSELLADGIAGPLQEKQQHFVKRIREAGDHLLRLINDILDLSKIEAGKVELQLGDFALFDALNEVLSNIRPLVMMKKVQLENQAEDLPVHADRVRFKQVLYNLLSNAVKFTPAGGKITVGSAKEGEFVRVWVRDTGMGISPENQEEIFQEFKQVGETTRGVREGTGLGLAITRRLVEQHEGKIWVESELGKGSCFYFTIRGGEQADLRPPQPAPLPACKSPLVLIIDDEADARELMVEFLTPEGYRTATAGDCKEGLEKAQKLAPDLITLNMLSPGKGGMETLWRLKSDPGTKHIPIVIVSIVDDKNMGFALGAADYLVKPVTKQVLLQSVNKQLGKSLGDNDLLVVDDDAEARLMISETLQSAGYSCHCAGGGAEALQILEHSRPQGILLDLMMPEVDGFEVIARIKQMPALTDVPIFVLTAKDLTEEERATLRRETHAFFQKEIPWKNDLLMQVKRLINNARSAGAQ